MEYTRLDIYDNYIINSYMCITRAEDICTKRRGLPSSVSSTHCNIYTGNQPVFTYFIMFESQFNQSITMFICILYYIYSHPGSLLCEAFNMINQIRLKIKV